MLLLSYCFDKIVCMCGCVCEYKRDKQKKYIATYIFFFEGNECNKQGTGISD